MKSMKSRILGITTASLAAGSVMFGMADTASATLPLWQGTTNFLAGVPRALDENYVAQPAVGAPLYTMPDGSVEGVLGTPGMTESIFTAPRVGAPLGGLNVPQPAFLSPLLAPTDPRALVPNPIQDFVPGIQGGETPQWGARAGAVIRWTETADAFINMALLGDGPGGSAPFGAVTGVLYNLTPGQFVSSTLDPTGAPVALINDGLAPGSSALDVFPDTLPFTTNNAGERFASFNITANGRDATTAAFFGTTVAGIPSALVPIIELYDDTTLHTLLEIPDGADPLSELDWGTAGHSFGPVTGASHDANDTPPALLVGELADMTITQTIREVGLMSGVFELDISVSADIIYTGGKLVVDGKVNVGSTGTLGFNFENIAFPVSAAGGLFPNGTYDRNTLATYDFIPGQSFSADQSFDVNYYVPEPLTTSLSLMGLAGLGASVRRRRA